MVNILYLLFILTAVVGLSSALFHDEEWEQFKKMHHKTYAATHDSIRLKQYLRSRNQMRLINSNYGQTWIADHNTFSDWTEEEKEKRYGLRIPEEDIVETAETFQADIRQQVPDSFSYKNNICMQPIGYQGRCSNCWAYAAIHSLEFAMCKKINTPRSLSIQQLMDCDRGGLNEHCVGGYITSAWDFLKRANGSFSTASYPYTSGQTGTKGNCRTIASNNIHARVRSFGSVAQNVAAIKQAVMTYGSVASIFKGSHTFNMYRAGIFNDNNCNKGHPNHTVNIIGWGNQTSSISGLTTKFWIVRNSWGTTWGEGGYFRIKLGVNMCMIEQAVKYVVPY